jgi:hypothetical protein
MAQINVIIGQKVVLQHRNSFDEGWKVKRVTPTGQIVVSKEIGYSGTGKEEVERRFRPDGSEVGAQWNKYFLRVDLDHVKETQREKAARREASQAILDIYNACAGDGTYWTKETFQKKLENLKTLMAKAEQAVAAI